MSDNISVTVKVRPLINREILAKQKVQWKINGNSIQSLSIMHPTPFSFDHIFDTESSNSNVFSTVAEPIIKSTLNGFNGTIFAYGQTSSGKTHTMMGNENDPGIMIMAIRELFRGIEACSDRVFMIRVGYIEIYNEKVHDLLNKRTQITIREGGRTNELELTNKEVVVNNEESIFGLLNLGNKLRSAASTKMNEVSSRSHAILRIIIESEARSEDKESKNGAIQVSYLNLVDLAGSERADQSNTTGSRLKEGGHINKSLLSLSCVIQKLSEGDSEFINYRDSKLTRILQTSLGGNANTAIICNITLASLEETYSTLNFAKLAKTIQNNAVCNEVYSDEVLMKKMRAEIARLQAELESNKMESNRNSLEKEIIIKESQFLRSKMRPKNDRRQTWHHMRDEYSEVSLMPIPKFGSDQPSSSNGGFRLSVLDFTLLNEEPSHSHTQLHTPKTMKMRSCFTPTPNKYDLKYEIGRLEDEMMELQEFTALENLDGAIKDVDIVKHLNQNLAFALEQLDKEKEDHWNLIYQKLDFTCSHCGQSEMKDRSNGEEVSEFSAKMSELITEKSSLEIQLKECGNVMDKNSELVQKLAQLQTSHADEIKLLNQQLKTAKSSQENAEIAQAEHEISFSHYKSQSERRINELVSEVEDLKMRDNVKPADLNFSRIPIKTEAIDHSYDITELKSDVDKLKTTDEINKNIIKDLESQLMLTSAEKNDLQHDNNEMSTKIMEYIDDLESLKVELNSKKDELEEIRRRNVTDATTIEELRNINDSHIEALTKQKESLNRLEKEIIETKSQLSEVRKASEQAEIRNSEEEAILCKVMTENSHLQEQNAYLADKLVELEPLKTKNDVLISSIENIGEDNEKLLKQLDELYSKCESLKYSFEETQMNLHSLETSERDSQTKLNETTAALIELTSNYTAAKQTIIDLSVEIESLKSTLTSNEESIEKIETKVQSKERTVDALLDSLSSFLSQFEAEVGSPQSLNDCLLVKLETLRKLIKFKSIKQFVETFIEVGDLKLVELNYQVDGTSDEIDENIQKLKKECIELEELNSEHDFQMISQIKVINQRQADELKSMTESYAELESKFLKLEKSYDESCADTEKLQAIIDNNVRVLDKTEEECKTIKSSLLDSYDKIKISMTESELLNAKNLSLSEEVKDLKKLLQTKFNEIIELGDSIASLTINNLSLSEETKNLNKLLQAKSKEIIELGESVANLNDQLRAELKSNDPNLKASACESNEFEEKCRALIEDLTKLTGERDDLIKSHSLKEESFNYELKELRKQLNSLKSLHNVLLSQHGTLTIQNDELKQRLESKDVNLKSSTSETNELEEKFRALIEDMNKLRGEKDDLIKSHSLKEEKFKDESKEFSEQINSLKEKHDTLLGQHDSLTLKNNELKKQLESKDLSLKASACESKEFEGKCHALIKDVNKLHGERDDLIKSHSLKEESFNYELKELRKQLNSLKSLHNVLLSQHGTLTIQNDELKQRLESKDVNLKSSASETNELGEKYRALIEDMNKLRGEKDDLIKSHSLKEEKFKDESKEFSEQINSLKEKHDALLGQYDSLTLQNNELKQQLESNDLSLKASACESNEFKEECHALIKDMNKLRIERDDLINAYSLKEEDLNCKVKELLAQLNNLKDLHDALLDQHGSVTVQNDELKQQLSELEIVNNQIHNDFAMMKERLIEAESKLKRQSMERSSEMLKNVFELDEERKNPEVATGLKVSLKTDRKSHRHSQHDESRLSLNMETFGLPKSVAIQTDPINNSCSCSTMDAKIKELTKNSKIKDCIINSLKKDILYHPAKGENNDLKRKLEDREKHINMLQLNVNHYKAKANHATNGYVDFCRECFSRTKEFVHKEVQVGEDVAKIPEGQLIREAEQVDEDDSLFNGQKVHQIRLPQMYSDHHSKKFANKEVQVGADDIAKLLNGQKLGPLTMHQIQLSEKYVAARKQIKILTRQLNEIQNPEKYNGIDAIFKPNSKAQSEIKTAQTDCMPCSSSNEVNRSDEQICELMKQNHELLKKNKMYKHLAVSRRVELKDLKSKLRDQPNSNIS